MTENIINGFVHMEDDGNREEIITDKVARLELEITQLNEKIKTLEYDLWLSQVSSKLRSDLEYLHGSIGGY